MTQDCQEKDFRRYVLKGSVRQEPVDGRANLGGLIAGNPKVSDASLREAFIQLRFDFLKICRVRIDVIQCQMSVLQSDASEADRAEALDSMRREAHTIAGSSGTYGYAGVSRHARQLEDICNNAASSGRGGFSEAQMAELIEIYRNLIADADQMFADPDSGTVPF